MAAPSLDTVIEAIQTRFNIKSITDKQKESVTALIDGKDIFVSTRTGSGKSLSYECVPLVFDDSCVLVIAPLTTIMTEQCEKLNSFGFKATFIGQSKESDALIADGHFDFLFASPESVVGNPVWREAISSTNFKQKLKLIAVDEAHTVLQWGEGREDEDPFREWFSKIGELRSLFLDVPLLAMTATASPIMRKKIMRKLNFKSEKVVILDSSDRPNIKINTHIISSSAAVTDTFAWIIKGLDDKGENFPRHLVFCSSISACAKIYAAFAAHFGRAYQHVNMYHSKTYEPVKQMIRDDLNNEHGHIRVLICTNAAGMGVNFKKVNNVVHYGLPRDMDTFIQQMGRAGREGTFANELILMSLNKSHLKKTEPDLVRLARDKDSCRHKLLCESYLCKHEIILPHHNCCDVCELMCKCGERECPKLHPIKQDEEELQAPVEDELERDVSTDDKTLLRQQLSGLQETLASDVETLLDTTLYGLSDSLIDEVLNKCSLIFTSDDVMTKTRFWSYRVAINIAEIVNEVFGDTEMYGMEDEELPEDSDD